MFSLSLSLAPCLYLSLPIYSSFSVNFVKICCMYKTYYRETSMAMAMDERAKYFVFKTKHSIFHVSFCHDCFFPFTFIYFWLNVTLCITTENL